MTVDPELVEFYDRVAARLDRVADELVASTIVDLLSHTSIDLFAASVDIEVTDDGQVHHCDDRRPGVLTREIETTAALPRALALLERLTGRTAVAEVSAQADLDPTLGRAPSVTWRIALLDDEETSA